ncbi:MAG TPA: hypothetical protein VLE96_05400 [Chlamydiales bacterium]|nr:hypothetical protein [Chlamydiales bacterium]
MNNSAFWFCALAGSGLFLIQFLINVLGLGDSESKQFKWLSLQAITGFLMMFGWAALTCQIEFLLGMAPTLAISLPVGFGAIFVIRYLYGLTKKIHSDGSIYRIEEAIGKEATVYQRIPSGGTGKISVSLQNFTHEIDAISLSDVELPSFSRVKVIEKADANTVVVKSI